MVVFQSSVKKCWFWVSSSSGYSDLFTTNDFSVHHSTSFGWRSVETGFRGWPHDDVSNSNIRARLVFWNDWNKTHHRRRLTLAEKSLLGSLKTIKARLLRQKDGSVADQEQRNVFKERSRLLDPVACCHLRCQQCPESIVRCYSLKSGNSQV